MIYNGYFRQIKTDNLYTVRITTQNGDATKEITLGGTPFTTQMDDSDDTIYQPVKYQTATITSVTEDYMFDIYSSKSQDSKVELINKDNEIEFIGYVRPNLYDMGFERRREEIEIECSDGLATLKYIPYRTDKKQTVSFLYIINKLLKECNCYKGFYWSVNMQLTSAAAAFKAIDFLYISEANFFDDKSENETDDDVAWKCNEVLEEICRFCGVTCIADKDYVWFLDYDAIKNGINQYWYYAIDGSAELVTKEFTKKITSVDYSKNGAKISLDNVYNKVTVKADLNNFDSILPSIYDNLTNITSNTDEEVTKEEDVGSISLGDTTTYKQQYGEIVKSTLGGSEDENMIIYCDHSVNRQFVAAKYYKSDNYKFHQYKEGKEVTLDKVNFTDTKTIHGAFPVKMFVSSLNDFTHTLYLDQNVIDGILADNDISNISLSNYVLLLNTNKDDYFITNENMTDYPYMETTVSDMSSLFGGDNTYLVISGSYNYHTYGNMPYPNTGDGIDLGHGRRYISKDEAHMVCKLQWGDLYWSGSKWTETETTFNLPYMKADSTDGDRRADNTMFKDSDIRNTVNWRIGTSDKGYVIKCPNETLVEGTPKLTLYKPYDPTYNKDGQWYKHCVVCLKNFDIKAIVGNPTFSDNQNTDTEYTAVINDDYVNELSDIDFKINTWDNKQPNYSAVAYKTSNKYYWADRFFNKALSADVKGMSYINENNTATVSDGSLRQEWWLVYKIYKQYNSPSQVLKLKLRNDNEIYGLYTIHNLGSKQFIIDSIERNYQSNSTTIKFIEKT